MKHPYTRNQHIPRRLEISPSSGNICHMALASTLLLCSSHSSPASSQGFITSIAPYATSLTPEYTTHAILSAGDRVPLTSDPTKQFQMVGVPDGLGIARGPGHTATLFMNHELAGTVVSTPVIGEASYRGAIISQLQLDRHGAVLSGQVAYQSVIHTELGIELPPARTDNTTPAFVRFCSGTLAWKDVGFDRPIYLAGEENPAPATFDGRGGLGVAIINGKLHTLPEFGRFQHENLPVRPTSSKETTLILMEDNGSGYDSQLYLYVGTKDRNNHTDPLTRNGLTGGKVYVFVPTTPGISTEAQFQVGTITGKWVQIPGISTMSEADLETASDAVGAFGMIKCEDGAWSKSNPNEFFFNTTGDSAIPPSAVGNHFGRTYRLNLNPKNTTGPCTLSILYNADTTIAAGGDIALTPDNMDTSKEYLMVCEDGTGFSRSIMASKGRTGLIWRYDLRNHYAAEPIVTLESAGRDGVPVGPGVWETSGILNTEKFYGRNSWLFVVQAHGPTAAPAAGTSEDGQLILLKPARCDDREDDDHDED